MKYFYFIAIFCLGAISAPMVVNNQEDCFRFADSIARNLTTVVFSSNMGEISSKYNLDRKFSAGKGGAYVALVEEIATGEKKVIKIFPSIANNDNKYNFRELFYTCINGFITYDDLGMKFNPPLPNNNVFPKLYEVGITNASTMDGAAEQLVYPYMVFEFIKGKSLTSLGEDANIPESSDSYRLYKKGTAGFSTAAKKQSELVIYQIAHILYKMKRIKIRGQEYGFYHADLNAGNVMVKDATASGVLNAGFGDIRVNNMPLVTFIDFGHSTSNFDNKLGDAVNRLITTYHKLIRTFSGSTEAFYKNLVGSTLSKLTEVAIGASATNADTRLYRVIARAFYDSGNFIDEKLMNHLKDCTTMTDCVNKAQTLIK